MISTYDQENLTHALQAVAASKPLNQGPKALGVRTPSFKAAKTPRNLPLHHQEPSLKSKKNLGQRNGKENETAVPEGKKRLAIGEKSLVTPAGNHNRAPLGNKTTNAKTRPVHHTNNQTVGKGSIEVHPKSQSPRLRRQRVKIHQTVKDKVELIDEEPEIEYAPLRPEDLPNFPEEEFQFEKLETILSSQNLIRGYHSTYIDPIDDRGVPQSERQFERDRENAMAKQDALIQKAIDETHFLLQSGGNSRGQRTEMIGQELQTGAIIGLRQAKAQAKFGRAFAPAASVSRLAATALSQRPDTLTINKTNRAHFAAPTTSSLRAQKPRQALGQTELTVGRGKSLPRTSSVTSRSTIGYAKGRSVSATLEDSRMIASMAKTCEAPVDRLAPDSSSNTVLRSASRAPVPTSCDAQYASITSEDLASEVEELNLCNKANQAACRDGEETLGSWSWGNREVAASFDDEFAGFRLKIPAASCR